MRTIHVSALHWSAGVLLAVFGALVLVAPHQFAGPAYVALQPNLALWGGSFLAVGVSLFATLGHHRHARGPREIRWAQAARLAAGFVLLLLASGFVPTRGWTGVVVYGVLGVGCLLAALPYPPGRPPPVDLFGLVTGVSCLLNGLIILLFPGQFTGLFYDQMRHVLPWNGVAFLAGGAALLGVCLAPGLPRPAVWAGHLLGAFAMWLWAATNSIPLWVLTGVVYYVGLGLFVALLPWLGPWLERLDPGWLRMRLALALVAGAALPLILTLAVVTDQQERQATTAALATQATTARVLAQDVATYVELHEGAVRALAAQPGLTALPPAEQLARLGAAQSAFPDFTALETFDAAGRAIVRTDGRPLSPPADTLPLFIEPRRTRQPSISLHLGRVIGRPLVVLSAPVSGPDGGFAGVVIGAIDSSRLAAALERVSRDSGSQVALYDARGRLIAEPGAAPETIFADRSASPPVAALVAAQGRADGLRYRGPDGDRIAGFAPVPGLGWGMVVEQPAAAVFRSIYAGRDLAFVVLVVMLVAALAAGLGIAYQLARPLSALSVAAEELASQAGSAPLPDSRVREVADLTAIFASMRDRLAQRTTERDALYAAERDARQEAEQAVRMRDVFLSIAAHELRNPLTALLGNAQLLRRRRSAGDTLTERDERTLDTLLEQSRRLDRLITGLLDLSRIDQGQLMLERQPMDLGALAARVVAELQPTLHTHTLEYRGPGEPVEIDGDELRLEQVLMNLLQNAVRYSPDGDAVRVTLTREDGQAALSVTDSGIGIPADDLPRLFRRFARAGNAEDKRISGTGLGLYVVGEIVRLHGGAVAVLSEEGVGSTFTITLPLAATGGAARPQGAGATQGAAR
jgi:signal transduction histidine kinase